MDREATLDEFAREAGESEDGSDGSPPDGDDGHDGGEGEETAAAVPGDGDVNGDVNGDGDGNGDVNGDGDGDGERSREAAGDDHGTGAGSPITHEWRPGVDCEACGATVDRRWRDGDARVCADCKEW